MSDEKKEVIFLDKDGTSHRAPDLEEWIEQSFFRGGEKAAMATLEKIVAFLPHRRDHYREFVKRLIRQRKIEGGV